MMKPIPYGRQEITQADIEAVTATLTADFLTQGPKIDEFERAFAAYVGARFAVAVANGTAALHLSALALGTRPGSRVITSPLTFVATANCVRYCGGEVVLADIDPETGLLDLKAVERLLSAAPKGSFQGIIPVDYAGYPVDMQAFRDLADAHGCWLLEDACHAPGGAFRDRSFQWQRCGNGGLAELAIFSFHPVKHIACGEGGMITTRDEGLYRHLLRLRNHGLTKDPALLQENHGGWYYEVQELGFNYRLTDIQCALGLSQLSRAEEGLARRRLLAEAYDRAFAGTPVRPVIPHGGVQHAYHLYVVRVPDRRGLYDYLRSQQVFSQVHYVPVHMHPEYQRLGFQKGDFPHAEQFYSECLSLPLFPSLKEEEQEYVIEKVLAYYSA